MRRLHELYRERHGATAIEYGLICAFVVLAMVGALGSFAGKFIALFNTVASQTGAVQ